MSSLVLDLRGCPQQVTYLVLLFKCAKCNSEFSFFYFLSLRLKKQFWYITEMFHNISGLAVFFVLKSLIWGLRDDGIVKNLRFCP